MLPDFKRYGTCRWQFSQPYVLVLISVSDWVDPGTKVRSEDLSMKNSIDFIGSRNRDHSACSTVPQPNELCRAPYYAGKVEYLKNYCYHNHNNHHQSRVKPASVPPNCLVKDLPSRLHPFVLQFSIICDILLLFILVTRCSQFDLYLLNFSPTGSTFRSSKISLFLCLSFEVWKWYLVL
jgi:hypothetical protein